MASVLGVSTVAVRTPSTRPLHRPSLFLCLRVWLLPRPGLCLPTLNPPRHSNADRTTRSFVHLPCAPFAPVLLRPGPWGSGWCSGRRRIVLGVRPPAGTVLPRGTSTTHNRTLRGEVGVGTTGDDGLRMTCRPFMVVQPTFVSLPGTPVRTERDPLPTVGHPIPFVLAKVGGKVKEKGGIRES